MSEGRTDMTVVERLRERKLVQWAVAYAGGAWVVLEVFSTIQDGLGLPAILFPLLLAALAVGFLVTLVLAWYHGEQGRQKVSGPELLIIGGILVVAGLLSSVLLGRTEGTLPIGDGESVAAADAVPQGADETAPDESLGVHIAVLPLVNHGSEEDRGFVDGIHAEILATLSKIGSLAVVPSRSVLRYRDSPESARTIGEELGVRYVVDGSVQRADPQVRMRLTLTDARDDRIIWNDEYDPDLTVSNLVDIQREVALSVARGVGARVLPVEAERLETDAPENLEAYEHYLVGLSFLRLIEVYENDGMRDYEGAISSFEAAIAADPEWAPPWAYLGTVYHWMASRGLEADVNFPRSKASLDAALAIDSLFAPAWVSLAYVRRVWERDLEGADVAYANAIELGAGQVGWGRALHYHEWGRLDEAARDLERYLSLDPENSVARATYGGLLACDGQYEAAIRELERARFGVSYVLAEAYLKAGREQDGLSQVERLEETMGGLSPAPGAFAYLYALAGREREAADLLVEAERRPPGWRAKYAAAAALRLGQRDRALDFLERLASSNPEQMFAPRCPDEMRELEGDPRFERILEELGSPPLPN